MKKIIVNTILSLICYENTIAINSVPISTVSPNIPQGTLINTTPIELCSERPIHTAQSPEEFLEDSPPARPAPMLPDDSEDESSLSIIEPCSPPQYNFPITYPVAKPPFESIQEVIQKLSAMETCLNNLSEQINVFSLPFSQITYSMASKDFITTLRNLIENAQITLKNSLSLIQLEQTLKTYRQEHLMQQRKDALLKLEQIQQANTIEKLMHLDELNPILRWSLENMQKKLRLFEHIQLAVLNQILSLRSDSEHNSTIFADYLNNLHLLLSPFYPTDSEIEIPPSWQKQYNIQGDDFGENILAALKKHSFEVGELNDLLHNLSEIEEIDFSSFFECDPDKILLYLLKSTITNVNQGNNESIPTLHGLLVQLIASLHE